MEEYFVIPPWIGGFIIEENVIQMTKAEQTFVEKTLYPSHERVCEYQGRVTEMLFFDPLCSVEEIIKIQREFFANFNRLPDDLQFRFYESIAWQYRWFCEQHRIGNFKIPTNFFNLLDAFHRAMWNIAKSKVCYTSKN